ncbi:sugar MFS transporter [Petrimonas mucosa]|jgi:FHS family L-fucose permease-like MFS transporter|uniref:sugar MFS transporter n=1 Tax=Petrimonas mucosa TaxID=1642646 RepID=UPI001779514D|nr:sugar MFS transporter [Petrimonas mucosa]MDD3560426.1 sugar MFS transporter [Petrimonas mucosa]HHT29715.1 sugar MFS transporter [Petrimonas mucosa]
MNNTETVGYLQERKRQVISVAILAFMFFIFGFVSWVNAILIPYFKIACELTHFQSYFVAFAFYIAYFVMAIPSGLLLKRVGFKRGIMYGFLLMALGAFIFVPAALTRQFAIFLIGLFSIGTGLAILQTAANPYVTIIGPIESAAQRMSIMGICNKFAGIVSPLIFAAIIFKATDHQLFDAIELGNMSDAVRSAMLDELIRRVILPYTILGFLLLLAGVGIRYSILPELDTDHETAVVKVEEEQRSRKRLIDFPYLVLGAIAIFLHVGTQVVAIDTIINYAGSMGIGLLDAKVFPSYTLTATIIGYVLGIMLIPRVISQRTALVCCTSLGLLLSLGVIFADWSLTLFGHEANASIWFLALIGFPNALIYAGIWPLSIRGLGRFTKTGSSLLIMGLSGNAVLPLIYGALADAYGLRIGYWSLIPCFLYLVWFALMGHKIEYWGRTKK